ncbi:dehydration-responsive element-binding protein 2A-like [Aegilops tauschii subsp. strangulata]|uniref:dehydration-responsive element-binding protein 2A-like n=1 Tax=Aegilops tauschii subsp. strangulata TaxID=200361 RepID=UPI00098A545D|nr:ethylene-responsive transcription factor ERF110-like [Aegilops tauschii subsp. strangulata]
MPLHARSSSSYRGVRARPSGMYYAEIHSCDTRLSLGTFETANKAGRAYGTAAWRLSRPRSRMNFSDARTFQHAHDLAPPPQLITDEDRRIQRRWERRLLLAEADEHAMAEWRRRFREDVTAENDFWAQKSQIPLTLLIVLLDLLLPPALLSNFLSVGV